MRQVEAIKALLDKIYDSSAQYDFNQERQAIIDDLKRLDQSELEYVARRVNVPLNSKNIAKAIDRMLLKAHRRMQTTPGMKFLNMFGEKKTVVGDS